jgi:hypothetical protein
METLTGGTNSVSFKADGTLNVVIQEPQTDSPTPHVILGNYLTKLSRFYDMGLIRPNVDQVEIRHSSQCLSDLGVECNCQADILVNGRLVKEGLA